MNEAHYYVYLQRPTGHIIYDRTMPGEREAEDRVTSLKKRENVADAWHQTTPHPEAFY